jgi:hypothetical protein
MFSLGPWVESPWPRRVDDFACVRLDTRGPGATPRTFRPLRVTVNIGLGKYRREGIHSTNVARDFRNPAMNYFANTRPVPRVFIVTMLCAFKINNQ